MEEDSYEGDENDVFDNYLDQIDDNVEFFKTDKVPKLRREGRVIRGEDCQYIKISGIVSNSGCDSGDKFVIKQVTGVRKQFLIMNNEPILAFVNKGKKFTACDSYTEITSSVVCKEVSGLANVNLSASAAPSPTSAAPSPTSAAPSPTSAAPSPTSAAPSPAATTGLFFLLYISTITPHNNTSQTYDIT